MPNKFQLVERQCGCGIKFKVLPTSKQRHCGRSACKHVPEGEGKNANNFHPFPYSPRAKPCSKKPVEESASKALEKPKAYVFEPFVEADVKHLPTIPRMECPESLNTWDRCVEAAKVCVYRLETYRMLIATIAIKACDIMHGGGGHWSGFKNQRTITDFAKEIGINRKTLHEWVATKRFVIDKLPEKLQQEALNPKNYSRVRLVKDRVQKDTSPEEVLRRYRSTESKGINSASLRVRKASKYIQDLATNLGKKVVRDKSELEDLERILNSAEKIVEYLKIYVRVRKEREQ